MVDQSTQSTVSKVVGLLVAGGAAWVAQKAVSTAWRSVTGHVPPKAEDEGDAGLSEVAVAAAITGAIAALTRVLATRATARFLS
ncbi:DUF4235 domain-containing protein [Cellulomonas aerilata]|uniref:DUF4235 domain-containing protein n=1 Tax=Cellulomonas aerilata TaxID=515326 RepID=A0A512D812_9CELL|nr:DUF4235 domain-containing protein [Cellulomonas aerilata]GEO32609.1 hypothetical protein CAE01nite_03340 [Cellulomonas aerilata]